MKINGDPHGPAVMLCNSDSLFPRQLATFWQTQGLEVIFVTRNRHMGESAPNGTKVFSSWATMSYTKKRLNGFALRLLRPIENAAIRLYKAQYTRNTGKKEQDPWESRFAAHLIDAFPTAQVARKLKPRFVFGQEIGAYGLPTALCKNTPRILFPWGADIFLCPETTPFFRAIIRYALLQADLILPSSTTAAHHICTRLNIAPEKVKAISWGVDRRQFYRHSLEQKLHLRAQWNIPAQATVFMNVRRFRPSWGCFAALEAFINLAQVYPNAYFVMLGGLGTESYVQQARTILKEKGLSSRFSLFDNDIPLQDCADLMALSDVTVSLLGRGDMRSASVLQGAAIGSIPIVSDLPEYREMEQLGFRALFVNPEDTTSIQQALRRCLENPTLTANFAEANEKYITMYEDNPTQLKRMLDMITTICNRYYSEKYPT